MRVDKKFTFKDLSTIIKETKDTVIVISKECFHELIDDLYRSFPNIIDDNESTPKRGQEREILLQIDDVEYLITYIEHIPTWEKMMMNSN